MLTSSNHFAQVNFEAKASKQQIGLNESITVDFEIHTPNDRFTAPSFNDFEIISGPSTSISNTWVNGEKTYKKTISYLVAPKKNGDLVIDEAIIEVDNTSYNTKALIIEVDDKYKKEETTPSVIKFNDNVHLVAEVASPNVTLNSAFIVTYKLFVSQDVGISDWKIAESPDYNNFDAHNIEIENLEVKNGTYKGESYRYVIFKQTELKPKQKGVFTIKPFKLKVTMEIPTDNTDIFGGKVMTPIEKTLATNSITITVN